MSRGSVIKMAGTSRAMDLSNWQKAIGFFNLRWNSRVPTRVRLTKHLVHPQYTNSKAFRVPFFSLPGISSSMGMVTGTIGSLTRGSSSLSEGPGSYSERVGVSSLGLGGG